MNTFKKKRFWGSLLVFGLINHLFFWEFIPQHVLSGNPDVDGVVVTGFPLTVKTSGGCNFGGSCMDFNLLHFWIDILILVAFTALIAYVFSQKETIKSGLIQVGKYLLGWFILFTVFWWDVVFSGLAGYLYELLGDPPVTRWISWGSFGKDILRLIPTWKTLIASILYNLYYFLMSEPFWFTNVPKDKQ